MKSQPEGLQHVLKLATGSRNTRYIAVATFVLITAVFLLVPPLSQNLEYHNFADQRQILGLQNFWNVMSNLPFLIVGVYGFRQLDDLTASERQLVRIYSIGLILVCFGSSWYHLAPANASLVWDRLAMTLSFMTMFAFVIGRVTNPQIAWRVLLPLIAIGLFSVFYWDATEQAGRGDLRLYALVQFLPGLVIAALLLTASSKFGKEVARWIWLGLAVYIAAKVAEWQDANIYELGALLSGHSIKHMLAALSSYYFLCALMTSDSPAGDMQ